MVDPLSTAAIGWGFSAAGWLISPILTRLLNKCFDALGRDSPPQFQSRKQILLGKLKNLQTTLLPKLLILTDAAQKSSYQPILQNWIQKLKSAFYEAEHVLGLVEYQHLEKEVNSFFPSTSKCCLKKIKGKFKSDEKKNLIKSLENLEEIVNEAMEFVTLLNLPSNSGNNLTCSNEQYRETISTPGSTIIGRETDRDYIVKLLREDFSELSSNSKCYSVIGIWGMGGMGKTTLAQYVCEHEKAAKHFDCILWAHVSEKFSVHAIFKNIWESGFKEPSPNFTSLEGLQSILEEKLRGKMFFLVWDDVWCDKGVSEHELEQLFAPLRAGKRGSKILVTTRIEAAAKSLGAMNPIPLRELDDEQFISLFLSNAISDVEISDNHMKGRLISIGNKIAAKLCRPPLAAKTVTAQLRRRLDPKFWLSMLNRSLLNNTMGALFLSYQHLPPPLQRCFAFCSLFPKGYVFQYGDNLVNLWIAEGFIETKNSNEIMKDIANQYILDLISSSFFQVDEWGRPSMHDLIHDLAQEVSEGEYFRIGSEEKKEIPAHTRHIYVDDNHMIGEYVDEICKLKDLRTIISTSYSRFSLKEEDLDALFKKLRKLYVVEIKAMDVIKRVPKSVAQLRNLQYLNLSTVPLSRLLNRLYQLRFFYTSSQIPDLGRLISLVDLKDFNVKMERGFEIKQLEHLRDLYGSLSIHGLNNVKSEEDAYQAKLSDKKGLHILKLYWDYESNDVLRDINVEILDGLCPPLQIKELTIENYSGKRFPNWISENNDNIIHLQHLELDHCVGLEALHGINELPDLLSLSIRFLSRLKSWVPLPLNLIRLDICNCISLAFAVKEDLDMIMSTKGTRIYPLVSPITGPFDFDPLYINDQFDGVKEMMKYGDHTEDETLSTISKDLNKCLEKRLDLIFQLKDVYGEPFLPPTLESLSIKSCFITDKILAGSLQRLTSLTFMRLENIITITCIPKEVLSSLTNLVNLYIFGCLLLTSIGGLDSHSTLTRLHIRCCPYLTFETSLVVANSSEIVELTSSSSGKRTRSSVLKYVALHGCMPSDDMFQDLISVEDLDVCNCPTMVNPHIGHLKALCVLELQNCPNLASLRGLSELNNLKYLKVLSGCDKLKCYSDADKLPQLKELIIFSR
ncbi:putative disease resistance protein RGA1 [Carex rostrata]